MTRDVPGLAPEHDYESSFCNQALLDAGLDIVPPPTGCPYTSDEKRRIARSYRIGPHLLPGRRAEARRDAVIEFRARQRGAMG